MRRLKYLGDGVTAVETDVFVVLIDFSGIYQFNLVISRYGVLYGSFGSDERKGTKVLRVDAVTITCSLTQCLITSGHFYSSQSRVGLDACWD
jgi:hypothetical protein